MNLCFSGKSVMIAGGSCTMALTLAELLIAEGLFPVMGYRRDQGKQAIQNALACHQGAFETCLLDFSAKDSLSSCFESLPEGPDYLVDFAQGDYDTLISSADEDRLGGYLHDTITQRAIWLKQATRRMIKKKFGRLVFVSSTAAVRPNPGQGLYAASKLASEALYKTIALELAPLGITCVSLRPGYVDAGRGKTYIDNNRKRITKILSASDIAQTLLFLLSDSALGFNATELVMDHGLTARKST